MSGKFSKRQPVAAATAAPGGNDVRDSGFKSCDDMGKLLTIKEIANKIMQEKRNEERAGSIGGDVAPIDDSRDRNSSFISFFCESSAKELQMSWREDGDMLCSYCSKAKPRL